MIPDFVSQTQNDTGGLAAALAAPPPSGPTDRVITSKPYVPASSSSINTTTNSSKISSKDLQILYEYNLRNLYSTPYSYQDVNADKKLQYSITDYFLEKTIDWMKHDKSFKKVKQYLRYLTGPDGEEIMHKILRLFVKKGETNWYDLKIQKSLVKDYIRHRLAKL